MEKQYARLVQNFYLNFLSCKTRFQNSYDDCTIRRVNFCGKRILQGKVAGKESLQEVRDPTWKAEGHWRTKSTQQEGLLESWC